MSEKVRLDQLLFQKGFFDSREKARRSIMAGVVFIDNQRVDKPGTKISENAVINIKENVLPYVSRGGLKLEKAIAEFNIKLDNNICLDIGASTGGFTDCMLQNGAQKVFSIDVGYGQLDWKLRQDPRVICMERTNIRYVELENIGGIEVDFASIDVSFISLKLVLPVVKKLIKVGGEVVALIKPQFEAGRDKVGKKGVVRDILVHKDVVVEIVRYVRNLGFTIKGFSFSPIKGPEGNIEYLLHLKNSCDEDNYSIEEIKTIIEKSHIEL
ncbi:TlyA family RNA methyltransferase [Alkaliphilus peptidifermentans]|uniref:23S rRNA (Cytidine1920-2'-O)/16S rRNA (Cytidine1409-2'-O)-methyltransferase n=1 Tax=Alkaliphilus peptidifermentans DSM 18978 TaxID=1120976 RepID=A0A1G5KFC9_9FIRM|nr:TlyA family RNA methyltransferase [Alkaliphilus peptidifermentans]SCY98798.1 23S rRNA (cytidine1920-2'-O)/16S rRNA (cytidine1409-2'-O)-methyltransferase [Alkaliphilus peptidifermentans DSM 18978]